MNESNFEKQQSSHSQLPKPKFFAFVGRGDNLEINKIKEFIENSKVELYFHRRSDGYLRIVYADDPTKEEQK